jgi:mRNA interferase YafQ
MPREIIRATQFRKDYKRESKGQSRKVLETEFLDILNQLIHDIPLDQKHNDHPLKGKWIGYRDCHIKSDMVLIYRKANNTLELARLGSHSELDIA